MTRQKRRWTWKNKHLRKHRFSFKGIRWKGEWYWYREKYSLEDHEKRRTKENIALHKIWKGYEEEDVYFPEKWKDTKIYFY